MLTKANLEEAAASALHRFEEGQLGVVGVVDAILDHIIENTQSMFTIDEMVRVKEGRE